MIKICFYCDSIFSVGGVQRILAVIAGAISAKHEVTILTLDKPEQEDLNMYELGQRNIRFRYISLPYRKMGIFALQNIQLFIQKRIIPQIPITSQWYGYSSFPHTQRKVLIGELNNENYDIIVGVHAFLSLQLASIRHRLKARRVVGWMHTSFNAFFNTPGFYLYEQKNQFRHEMTKLDGIIVLTNYDRGLYERELNLFPIAIYNPFR